MTTNFYSTNQFLYEPKLLFRNLKSRDGFWRDSLYFIHPETTLHFHRPASQDMRILGK